jgi:formylglycine-generating enzyme required for sulfatase activity
MTNPDPNISQLAGERDKAIQAVDSFLAAYPQYITDGQVTKLWRQLKIALSMTRLRGVSMVAVPGGVLNMGQGEGLHEVPIKPFYIDLTPVTNEAYAAFIHDGGYMEQKYWTKAGWRWLQQKNEKRPQDHGADGFLGVFVGTFMDPQQPRVGVTWHEAYAYCKWRGGRLPTEAEWEWAARGPQGYTYPWGNTFEATHASYWGRLVTGTSKVDAHPEGASWIGALDMSGNVWEWVSSLYEPYPYAPADSREDPDSDAERVIRGGSWSNNADQLQASHRGHVLPAHEENTVGFRCAFA